MSYAADTTLVTTGMLPALMLASAALTAPASLFLLWLYRRAVLRSMAEPSRPTTDRWHSVWPAAAWRSRR